MAKILNVHIPADMKNYIKNGALDFWQEKEGAVATVNTASTTEAYSADMFAYLSGGATIKNYSLQRSTDIPTVTQSGYQSTYSNLFTMITGIASPAAGDYVVPFGYKMEGFDYEELHTKTVTFGFWTKASIAGTYSFAVKNAAGTRSYVTTFAISGANTWEYKTITLTLDNAGTWLFNNSLSLYAFIGVVGGSSVSTATLNQWQGGDLIAASGVTNWMGTNGATLRVTQLSLVKGSLGLGATGFQRQGKDIGQELLLCQRYFEKSYVLGTDLAAITLLGSLQGRLIISSNSDQWNVPFAIRKRGTPTGTIYSTATGAVGNYRNTSANADNTASAVNPAETNMMVQMVTGGAQATNGFAFHWVADARL